MWYYCEVARIDKPYFPGYRFYAKTDQEACAHFLKRFKDRLECVYDDDFRIVYEVKM